MIERLVQYIARCETDALEEITLEDIAVCRTWLQANPAESQAKYFQDASKQLEVWGIRVEHFRPDYQGQRTQPLLRAYIDALRQGHLYRMKSDELAFLANAAELATTVHDAARFERIRALIEPYRMEIRSRLTSAPAQGPLAALGKKIEYTTERDIEASRPRNIRSLAGIELAFVGPVFSCKGLLKVLGSVPVDTLVHVEEGSCIVCGFVMGLVCATMHCQVSNNVSGKIVVRNGEVRCRNIIDRATVITKTGSVHCYKAMDPKLIFAGARLRIAGSAIGGMYKSKLIEIEHEVVGGEFHVTERLAAERLRSTDVRRCNVVLRAQLTSEDYGEPLSREAIRLLSTAHRLKRKFDLVDSMIKHMDRENEQLAQAALLVICGGDAQLELMTRLEKSERRINLLNRVISAARGLRAAAEERYLRTAALQQAEAGDDEPADADDDAALTELFADIEQSPGEDSQEAPQHEELHALKGYHDMIGKPAQDRKSSKALIISLQDRIDHWTGERDGLQVRIDQMLAELTAMMGRIALLDKFGEKAPKTEILRSVVQAIVGSSGNEVLKERLTTTYVRYAIAGVVKRTERIDRYRKDVDVVRENLTRVVERLEREFLIRFDFGRIRSHARVTGVFDSGVYVYADSIEEASELDGESRRIVTKGTDTAPIMYQVGEVGLLEKVTIG